MNDELGEGRVERLIWERQALGRCLVYVDTRIAFARGRDERLGGSAAETPTGPTRETNSVVSAPGPQPTSSTR